MATKKQATKRKIRRFAQGGFSDAQEEWLGGADRTDPYILARMRSAVPDATKDTYENNAPYKSDDQGLTLTKEMVAAERAKNGYTKTSVTAPKAKLPMPDYSNEDLDKMGLNDDLKPAKKKPYIDIPDRSSIGVRQFKSDATSPVGRVLKKLYGNGMKAGGSVSSASKRGDGCAIRGKTRA